MIRRILLALVFSLAPAMSFAQDVTAPVWDKPDHFWFRKTLPGGTNVWLGVDALHGVKEPLFDHQRLAIELRVRTGVEFDQNQLPFVDPAMQFVVKYDGANSYIQQGAMAVEFVMNGQHWRCELQIKWDWNKVPPTDYECTPRRPFVTGVSPVALPADPGFRASPDGKWRAIIQNHNVVIQPLNTTAPVPGVALSKDGTAAFPYHLGSIRWSADSKSLSAYRVNDQIFQANSVTGNVKSFVVKAQWTVPE